MTQATQTQGEREFWCMVYRAVMMLASAIKRYKLDAPGEAVPVAGPGVTATVPVPAPDLELVSQ